MEEVSLQEMLAARERRCYLQTQLLHQYKKKPHQLYLNHSWTSESPDGCSGSICERLSENRDTVKRPSGSYSAYGNHKRKNRI